MEKKFSTLIISLLLLATTIAQDPSNQLNGPGNLVLAGTGNIANGVDNTFNGSNNLANGNLNNFQGDLNSAAGN